MKKREKDADAIKTELFERYPALKPCAQAVQEAYCMMKECYENRGKLLVAGNGGSAADSEHIVGELMKSFLFSRAIRRDVKAKLESDYDSSGMELSEKLEGALPAIPLTSMPALTTAFANDVDAAVDFAQKLYGYGREGDVFLGISTSGNAKNIQYAFMVAHAMGIRTILLTGGAGGRCRALADLTICVPESETFKIQEYHLPIYHALCAMLEADYFEER